MDEKIIQCANELIKAINESGRSVLRQDCLNENSSFKTFGSVHISIFDNEIQVERGGDGKFQIDGKIEDYC